MLPSKLCNLAVMALVILVVSAVRTQAADKETQSAKDKKTQPGNRVLVFDRHQLQASADYAYGGVPGIFSRPPSISRNVALMISPAPQDYYWPLPLWGFRKVEGHLGYVPLETLYGVYSSGLIPYWPLFIPW